MGWKPIDTKIPELLSWYGLRSCEIIEKNRFKGSGEDEVGKYILIERKSKNIKPLHVKDEDFYVIVSYYENPKQIAPSTLYRRLKSKSKLYPGQIHRSVTHKGRKDRYANLPKGATLEDFIAIGQELDHSVFTAIKHYNLERIAESKRKILKNLKKP
jgi:hypothetical protein